MESMKPIVLKAGIPLAITLAGLILARIMIRRSSPSSPPSKIQVNIQETDSAHHDDDDLHSPSVMIESSELQQKILGLTCKIQDFQDAEWRLEKRFLNYQELKEQDIELMELQNKFESEINRVEFLEREISLLEDEEQRFNNMEVQYLELLRLMEGEIRDLKLQSELLLRDKNEISYKLVAEESAKIKAKGEQEQEDKEIDNNFGGPEKIEEFVQSDSYLALTTQNHHHSKRLKIFEKFKRWVEKEKHGKDKCFQRTRVYDDGKNKCFLRKSLPCSSA